MAAEVVKGLSALKEEHLKAKETLKDVDESITKLTGREPFENRFGARRGRGTDGGARGGRFNFSRLGPRRDSEGGGRGRIFNLARRSLEDVEGPPAKRRSFGSESVRPTLQVAASRLVRPTPGQDSGDEDDVPEKPTVQSSIIASPREVVSRQQKIAEQNKDEPGKARNRRMFGLLMGTLQRFKDDEKVKDTKEKQRKAIEMKLEQKVIQEKADLRKERQTLFNERRQQQIKLRKIEQKMELVEIHEEWKKKTRKLMGFIRTKAEPHLFYLPKVLNTAATVKLKQTAKALEDVIVKRKMILEDEIEDLMQDPPKESEKDQEEEMEEHSPHREVIVRRDSYSESPTKRDSLGKHGSESRDSLERDQRVVHRKRSSSGHGEEAENDRKVEPMEGIETEGKDARNETDRELGEWGDGTEEWGVEVSKPKAKVSRKSRKASDSGSEKGERIVQVRDEEEQNVVEHRADSTTPPMDDSYTTPQIQAVDKPSHEHNDDKRIVISDPSADNSQNEDHSKMVM